MWLYIGVFLLVVLIVALIYIKSVTQKDTSFKFKGSHIIITGGSSGIGLELACQVAAFGANVTILARDEKKLQIARERIITSCLNQSQIILSYSVDVSNEQDLHVAIQNAAAVNNSKIDALICSAGVTNVTRFMESPISHVDYVMKINFNGSVYATHAVIPFMQQQKYGRIVYVSSILGLMGCPGYSVYSASKFALRGFAESLQSEFASWNIFFSVAVPSNVDTPMFEEEEKLKSPETKAIEGHQKPVHPSAVAADIVSNLMDWRFFVTTGSDPWLVSNITSGFAPASFFEFLSQPFLAFFGRFIIMSETKKFRTICKQHYNQVRNKD